MSRSVLDLYYGKTKILYSFKTLNGFVKNTGIVRGIWYKSHVTWKTVAGS